MTDEQRPVGMASDAVWPPRARPRGRPVIVTPGVTITRAVLVEQTAGRALQRVHPDVRSGLVDPDVGLVPPPPDNSHAAPEPDTEDMQPETRAAARPPKQKVKAKRR